jgi:hypothetical protein
MTQDTTAIISAPKSPSVRATVYHLVTHGDQNIVVTGFPFYWLIRADQTAHSDLPSRKELFVIF